MGKNINTENKSRIVVVGALQLSPQSSCPIASGQRGEWMDTNGTRFYRGADGSDTPIGAGQSFKTACRLATAAALNAQVYDADALTLTQASAAAEEIDGEAPAVGDRVLVKNQVDATQNGIYVVTTVGTGAVKQKLTRASDANQSAQFSPGFLVGVSDGDVNADSFYVFTPDSFVLDEDDAIFSAAPLAITYATASEIADLDSGAESAGVSDTAARGDHKHAITSLTGASFGNVANVNTVGGPVELFRTLVPSGANGDVDITLAAGHKIRVVDAWAVLKGAGTAGCLLTLKSTGNAISDAMDVSAGGDKDVFRVGEIDDAQHEIAGGGILRWSKASTGGDFPGAEAYVLAVRVA